MVAEAFEYMRSFEEVVAGRAKHNESRFHFVGDIC
jgi:hypothetical protein